jgi:hypothetical protein
MVTGTRGAYRGGGLGPLSWGKGVQRTCAALLVAGLVNLGPLLKL